MGDRMKYTKIIKRETKIMIGIVVVLVVIVLGVSYSLFMQVNSNTNNQVVTTGTLQVEYPDDNGFITNDKDIVPISNDAALTQKGYKFSVKNTGSLPVAYQVYLYVNKSDYEADKASGNVTGDLFEETGLIKFNLQTNNNGNKDINKLAEQMNKTENGMIKYRIYNGTILENNSIDTHNLIIWLDEDMDTSYIGKYIYLKLEVNSYVNGQEPQE